ncbi:MAG TPA: M23 family metallopeptidase [Woeseiaceae bacterium]|nr:M23 family metallopeptidase [Woeseiaceae bacterium]
MHIYPIVGVLCLLVITAADTAAGASPDCRDGWICIDEVRYDGYIELIARNLQTYPITYTLQARSHSAEIEGPDTVTATLSPYTQATAIVLRNLRQTNQKPYSIKLGWTVGDMNANHDDDHLYAFPYEEGHSYRILQGYGSRFSHTGREEFAIDFDMPVGTPVHAARAGIVARVTESNDKGCWDDGCGAYANFIVVLHSDGTTGEYYHLVKDGALVEVGDSVARGQKIGYSGNTGHTALPHLHFAVYRATDWGQTQSIPVRFQSADGTINTPRRGGRHQAAY